MKLPPSSQFHRHSGSILALSMALAGTIAAPAALAAPISRDSGLSAAALQPTGAFWQDAKLGKAKVSAKGAVPYVQPTKFRATTLDRNGMAAFAAGAPLERTAAGQLSPLTISLPHPDGGFQRFTLVESPVMEQALADKHPEIKTYAGRGIDDPKATVRMDMTPHGLHASVRTPKGNWYIDPYFHQDDSVYASYHSRDLPKPNSSLREPLLNEAHIDLTRGFYHAADAVEVRGFGFVPGATVTITVRNPETDTSARQTVTTVADQDGTVSTSVQADPSRNLGAYEVSASDGNTTASAAYHVVDDSQSPTAASGTQLRTYRLALLSDPGYANFHGAANVTAAKVTLINRVTQVYEDETAIRLVLVANNDALNLNTAAQFSQADGPCGGTACFPTASVSCSGTTLTRTRQVIGLLVGASNFDIGHIGVGAGGGGIASLGVVGGSAKAQGCTGLPTPVGDLFAVDYVAHEMGHQFAGNHTFNGVSGSCTGGNRNPGTSVEPGSGSSIMAYAGICSTDDLQPHSDAYWSQRSFDEIMAYTTGAETLINEVQMGVLKRFNTNGQQFQLSYAGSDSAPIVRGTNFTTAGIKAALEALPSWTAGGTVTVSALTDTAFTLTFGGTMAGTNLDKLQLVNASAGVEGYIGEIAAGGSTTRRGSTFSATGNTAPTVTAPTGYTIPVRTPFALTGSAIDAEGDTLTYMWEQNDRGAATGTGLLTNGKTNGPLFRQFGLRAVVSEADTVKYNSPGENIVSNNPTRVFPDLAQILANNTNAETGACPTVSGTATAEQIDCYSEYLPTAAYVGFAGTNASPASLNFRLTARDGRGGVNSANTQLVLAPNAGPFLVTWPNSALVLNSGTAYTVTWNVANTNTAPVNTSQVKISLSTDGGNSFAHVLAASVPNNGSASVTLPVLAADKARIKVEAVDNVFFDVSNADFSIKLYGDVNGDGSISCADLSIVRASLGKRAGQPGFDPRADVNGDGVVDIRDMAAVSKNVPAANTCNK
ncbi:M12 family metallo-peptidase [Paucibacter sp. DJ1R-11]|uniref:M12 family metallo-peptidase n=1 Tax=Paucibacter sp. DJ1R-11 TaxID=2893556 RepID=UPI0021E35ED3|nr:M12 family metallo-peptidase [Paucibacter sp. DJ1R-11]MCV2362241.1 M12 family metallo-peptidase [Paucibacter sp. DJ1R-11]